MNEWVEYNKWARGLDARDEVQPRSCLMVCECRGHRKGEDERRGRGGLGCRS